MTDFEFDSNQVVDEAEAFIHSILYPCLNICMLFFLLLLLLLFFCFCLDDLRFALQPICFLRYYCYYESPICHICMSVYPSSVLHFISSMIRLGHVRDSMFPALIKICTFIFFPFSFTWFGCGWYMHSCDWGGVSAN